MGNIDEFGEWQCKSAVTIEVARERVDKEHWVEKVRLRAKECEGHRKLAIKVGSMRILIFGMGETSFLVTCIIVSHFGRGGK